MAALTMTSNEGDLLRVWVEHYAKQVSLENVYVLDDGSTDGSTEGLGCQVLHLPKLPGGASFRPARLRLINGLGSLLLAAYDYVVFADVDEFILPDPTRYADLPELVQKKGHPEAIASIGLNVVHVPQVEGPLDLSRPILEQRSFAKFAKIMCKPSIKRTSALWDHATHGLAVTKPYATDAGLFMLHLKFADRDRLAEVAARRRALGLPQGSKAKNASWASEADEIVATVDASAAALDLAAVKEFDVRSLDLHKLAVPKNGHYRALGPAQLKIFDVEPTVRIPARLRGLV
jgi:hypothetical protein